MAGRSLRKRIDEMCRTCVYDPAERGTWRQQVTLCACTACSLYPVRPVSADADALMDAANRANESRSTANLIARAGGAKA